MSRKREISKKDGLFFITFTCYKWMPLFQICNAYDLVYSWFDILIEKGHQISGYVIMPNHIHVLVGLRESEQTINKIVANGKRFMAYKLVKRLEENSASNILFMLKNGLTLVEMAKGQKHRVFESSFDAKPRLNSKFIEQKLDYIHNNPCSKKWNLAENPIDYRHSSMKFYETYNSGIKSKLTPYTAIFGDLESPLIF